MCEAAYLAGGPLRVTDLTLVSMHRERRLLLAHTGWATVVDAGGAGDGLERAVLGPSGRAGSRRFPPSVRWSPPTTPYGFSRRGSSTGARRVRGGAPGARGGGAGGTGGVPADAGARDGRGAARTGEERAPVVAAFALPLLASGLCLLIGRVEVYPYTRWASPAGQRLLAGLSSADPLADPLTALATRGPAVLEPELRAALKS
ncbi:TIGR04222 domain-containing membrane protein [Streptomyces diastatochromogenes]|nr:TIGR04222 domain-containing membrane protein [Streptomyces diastatochromogenes]